MINNEKVIFNMASMPSRIPALPDTVNSILPQCDLLNIYLNKYEQVPSFLDHPKIKIYRSQHCHGDLGDVGKFYKVHDQKGYIFTVDDKIIYPADYVQQMVNTIERTHRKAVVSNHGRNFYKNRPSRSYYFDCERTFMYMLEQKFEFIHEVGTGVLAFHSDTVSPDLDWFPHTNMTDIYFSIECQKRGIPLVMHPHAAGWIKLGTKHNENISIHASCNRRDEFQTKVVNDFDWKILTCPVDVELKTTENKQSITPGKYKITISGLECNYNVNDNRLAIIIPVLNNLSFTKNLIRKLQEKRREFFIIIIDDGSTDGTQEYAFNLISEGNNVIYHRHEITKGVNASWNEGITIARAFGLQHIAILNNDLELMPDWEISLLDTLRDKTVGIVSPYSTYGEKLPDKWTQKGSVNPLGFDILGCCFMFRSDLIDAIGYIPETLHTYYGDNWFSEATKHAGLKVVYCPESLIHHYYQQTTGKLQLKPQLEADQIAWNKLLKSGLKPCQ